MDGFYGEKKPTCYFHPTEIVIGICAHCLKERLLVLYEKQTSRPPPPPPPPECSKRSTFGMMKRKAIVSSTLPKVSALTSFLNHLLDSKHHDHLAEDDYSSLEDSFISIKFEEDGQTSWENKKDKIKSTTRSMMKRGKRGEVRRIMEQYSKQSSKVLVRWRNQIIGRLLQFMHWKRSNVEERGRTCNFCCKPASRKSPMKDLCYSSFLHAPNVMCTILLQYPWLREYKLTGTLGRAFRLFSIMS